MAPSRAATTIHSSTLHVEFTASGRAPEVHPAHAINLIEGIQFTGHLANGVAMPRHEPLSLRAIEITGKLEPRLIRLRYGSPFEVAIQLAGPVLGSVSAMSIVIYAIHRIWNLPTELQTQSAKAEAEFLNAETRAILARTRRDEAHDHYEMRRARLGAERRHMRRAQVDAAVEAEDQFTQEEKENKRRLGREFESLDAENGWPRGAISRVEGLSTPAWVGKSATWLDESDVDWSSF